jgi:hypothetical protein
MNRILFASIAVAAAAFAGAASADDITVDTTRFVSGKSRAEVQAELQQYRQSGVNPWSQSYNPLRSFKGEKTRAEVTGEFLSSRNEAAALTAEDSGSAYLSARGTTVAPNTATGD